MRKRLARILAILLCGVLTAGAVTYAYRTWQQHANARSLTIATANGIQEAQFVRIGGIDQWVQIRGRRSEQSGVAHPRRWPRQLVGAADAGVSRLGEELHRRPMGPTRRGAKHMAGTAAARRR